MSRNMQASQLYSPACWHAMVHTISHLICVSSCLGYIVSFTQHAGSMQYAWAGQEALRSCWIMVHQHSAAHQHRTWPCTGLPTGVMWTSCSS
jgi:hypothetical protein